MKLVRIKWLDSYGVGQNWSLVKDVVSSNLICVSVGYLAVDNDHVKVVVPHIALENAAIDHEEQGCGGMSIPTQSILELVELEPVDAIN